LYDLLQRTARLDGSFPAKALTLMFPLNPDDPRTLRRINRRGDVSFQQGLATNSGRAGEYRFEDANIGEVSFRLSDEANARYEFDDSRIEFTFGGDRPVIAFGELPNELNLPKVYDVHSLSMDENRILFALENTVAEKQLTVQLSYQQVLLASTNQLSMIQGMMVLAANTSICCQDEICVDDDGEGPYDADERASIGYFFGGDPTCTVMKDIDIEEINSGPIDRYFQVTHSGFKTSADAREYLSDVLNGNCLGDSIVE